MKKGFTEGFTLLEVILCLTIVAMISALMTPAFMAAKRSAKATVTKSNLHQISVALALYRQNYDDAIPSIYSVFRIKPDGRKEEPYRGLGLSWHVWQSGCGPHPLADPPEILMTYAPGELSEQFESAYAEFGEQHIAVWDDRCTDLSSRPSNIFAVKRGLGVLLDGTIIDKTGVGLLSDPAWWVTLLRP